MKVTILNNKKPAKNFTSLFSSIGLFLLGVILIFNSGGLIRLIFNILGATVILFGIQKFCKYYQLKNQLHVEQTDILLSAIFLSFIGFLVLILSNILVNTIQIVTGIWLLFTGISKINQAIYFKALNKKQYITGIFSGLIILFLGIYTIFAENVIFVFLGIVLILYSVVDFIRYFLQ